MENTNKPIIKDMTIRSDLADTGFKFFDRIEGIIYPGEITSIRRVSTKTEPTTIRSIGYESSFINQMRNYGEFSQSSGKLRLESFRATNTNSGTMDISFEFMNQDSSVYTVNEMRIWWICLSPDGLRTLQMLSPTLKMYGGIKNQTRITMNEFGFKYHHEVMDEIYSSLECYFMNVADNYGLELAIEVYIK